MLTRRQAAQVPLGGCERMDLFRSKVSGALEALKKAGNVKKEILKEVEDVLHFCDVEMNREVARNMEATNQVLTWKNKFLEAEKVKEELELRMSSMTVSKIKSNVTYSDVLKNGPLQVNGQKKVCVVENPDNLNLNIIKEKIRNTGIIKETGVRINKIFPTKKGKIVIEVPTSMDQAKIMENLNKNGTFKVREPIMRQKKYIVKGIPVRVTDQEIQSDLVNRSFGGNVEGKLKIIKIFTGGDKEIKNCIFAVDNDIVSLVERNMMAYIDYGRHRISGYIPKIQCLRCAEFGHMGKSCQKKECCPVCAGAHQFRDCPDKNVSNCANCIKTNAKNNGKKGYKILATDHQALYKLCPSWVSFNSRSKITKK